MKQKINKIKEEFFEGELAANEAIWKILDLLTSMPETPHYNTIQDKAWDYAKKQWINDCTYLDLKYAAKDFMNGAIWMMKTLNNADINKEEIKQSLKMNEDNMNINNLLKNEIDFCNEIDCIKNENGVFVYKSENGVHKFNLPALLSHYKDWLIEKNIVSEVRKKQ
jgi:uncharacterized membrane protein